MRKLYFLFILTIIITTVQAQQPGAIIDVQHYNFNIRLNDSTNVIAGKAGITLKFLKDVTSFKLDLVKQNAAGKGMIVSAVTENEKELHFDQDSDAVTITTAAQINSVHTYTVTYRGVPADGLIISTNKFGHRTFFGDNWPNRGHNWLPCADQPADKASVDFVITAPDHYQVVANGLKIAVQNLPGHLKLTHWQETQPLPTKVMVIGVADFAIDHPCDVGGVPVYTYVFPENKDAGFSSYAVAKEILPFYNKTLGTYAYKKLANVQSKTIFGGMENASAIFYFENSVGDKGIEELMAHEIAHQWFGDAVSEKNWQHIWLSEGFATYMTNVYLENKYGVEALKKRMQAQRDQVIAFEKSRFTPVVDTAVKSNYLQLLNPNSYEKGGWMLHMLRRQLGDAAFWKGIGAYYARYKNSNANTYDLQRELQLAGGQNLQWFFKQWLYTAGHPHLAVTWNYDAAKKMLHITIVQQQNNIYRVPLEYAVNGKMRTEAIKNKTTVIAIALSKKPASVTFDPNVNLFAELEVTEK
ncbi:M1 family metallopeptidase [soil metagenome]|jgi:aminopeptidase N